MRHLAKASKHSHTFFILHKHFLTNGHLAQTYDWWPFLTYFSLFLSFLQAGNSKCMFKKVADVKIRTQVLWSRKRPRCQLSQRVFNPINNCSIFHQQFLSQVFLTKFKPNQFCHFGIRPNKVQLNHFFDKVTFFSATYGQPNPANQPSFHVKRVFAVKFSIPQKLLSNLFQDENHSFLFTQMQ